MCLLDEEQKKNLNKTLKKLKTLDKKDRNFIKKQIIDFIKQTKTIDEKISSSFLSNDETKELKLCVEEIKDYDKQHVAYSVELRTYSMDDKYRDRCLEYIEFFMS